MRLNDCKHYNHMLLPKCAPHQTPDISIIENQDIWKISKGIFLARYTTNFDCGFETNWWYIIKDTPFDIQSLKSNRRYEINKGNRNFCVKRINPADYIEQIYEVQKVSYLTYPAKYRPDLPEKEAFLSATKMWEPYTVYAAFSNDNQKICGFIAAIQYESYIELSMQKVIPEYEKQNINFALMNYFLVDNKAFLQNGGYICDGERNISHETAFQDFLEKYFGFRKAFCKLNVVYNPKIKRLIKIIFPFRSILKRFDGIRKIHQLNSVLKMEDAVRKQV